MHSQILEHSREGVWIIDQNFATLYTNPSLAKMLRVPREERQSYSPFDFIPSPQNERFYYDLNIWNDELDENTVYKIQLKNGNKVWLEISMKVISLQDNSLAKLCLINDITKTKKIEKNQLENLRMYFSLFEDSPIPIWDEDFSELKKWVDYKKEAGITDFNNYLADNPSEIDYVTKLVIINKINKAVVQLNEGKSKEEIIRNLPALRTREFNSYMIKQIESIAKGELSCEFDAVLRTIKGNIRHVLFKWTVVKGYEHNYGRIYLTTTDLTNRIVEDNIRLQQTNRDKEILLREIHHRVKNNFQIITSLIRLQSSTMENEKLEGALTVLLNRIYSMAAVHELLYRSEKFETIDLEEYLTHLVQLLIESLQITSHIEFDIHSNPISITLDQASPFGLILNEIITNSIKHGFKELSSGKLYIHAKTDADRILVYIGDNGKGIDKENTGNTDSLGLALVESLVAQLNATIETCDIDPGVHYCLNFPLLTKQKE